MNYPKKILKLLARRLGYDVVAYRPFLELLPEWGIKTVLDVGANEGQFAMELRAAGYRETIYSFEPTNKAFASLRFNSRHDDGWQAINAGLGRSNEQRSIAVAADSQLTSLLAPIREYTVIGDETIELRRLEEWLAEKTIELSSTCLKIDTQGYEREVLAGAGDKLPMFGAIIVELAISKGYSGQPYAEEIIALLRSKGFDLWTTRRGTWTPHGKQEVEVDGLFRKRALS